MDKMFPDLQINLIMLGETHGAKANIEVIKKIISDYSIKSICFEWNPCWFDKNFKLKPGLKLTDGRYTREHADLITKIKRKMSIHCIDNSLDSDSWNTRDKKMAMNIKRILKSDRGTTLFVTGNLHSRKKTFYMRPYSKEKYIPAASYFGLKAVSVKICYGKGSIYNNSVKPVSDIRLERYFNKNAGKFHWHKSKSKFFDYEFWVRETAACKII